MCGIIKECCLVTLLRIVRDKNVYYFDSESLQSSKQVPERQEINIPTQSFSYMQEFVM